MQAARSVAGDSIDTAKTLTASRHEVSVIKKYILPRGKDILHYGSPPPEDRSGRGELPEKLYSKIPVWDYPLFYCTDAACKWPHILVDIRKYLKAFETTQHRYKRDSGRESGYPDRIPEKR